MRHFRVATLFLTPLALIGASIAQAAPVALLCKGRETTIVSKEKQLDPMPGGGIREIGPTTYIINDDPDSIHIVDPDGRTARSFCLPNLPDCSFVIGTYGSASRVASTDADGLINTFLKIYLDLGIILLDEERGQLFSDVKTTRDQVLRCDPTPVPAVKLLP